MGGGERRTSRRFRTVASTNSNGTSNDACNGPIMAFAHDFPWIRPSTVAIVLTVAIFVGSSLCFDAVCVRYAQCHEMNAAGRAVLRPVLGSLGSVSKLESRLSPKPKTSTQPVRIAVDDCDLFKTCGNNPGQAMCLCIPYVCADACLRAFVWGALPRCLRVEVGGWVFLCVVYVIKYPITVH